MPWYFCYDSMISLRLKRFQVHDGGLASWSWFIYVQNIGCLHWIWSCKEHSYPVSPDLSFWGHWRSMTRVHNLDLDLHIVTGLWYSHVQILGIYLDFEGERTSMSFKSWLGLWRQLEVHDWSLVFDLPLFESLALYIDFEVEKDIHVLEVLIGTLENS